MRYTEEVVPKTWGSSHTNGENGDSSGDRLQAERRAFPVALPHQCFE
jgi:hypothetical protein